MRLGNNDTCFPTIVVAIQFFQNVMEIFVWLEVMPDQVELKCAIITHGGQCVMMDGVSRMLEWCADNLDYQHHVNISTRLPKSWLYRFYVNVY